jgi:hypothetical protein
MKRLLFIAALCTLCEGFAFAQGIVWTWVPNSQQGLLFPDSIGNPIYATPQNPVVSIPIDMTGDGTVDFEFRARAIGTPVVEVLQEGANAVLSENGSAINLSSGVVSSLTPVGANWQLLDSGPPGSPYTIGSMIIGGVQGEGIYRQFIDQNGYVGVEFYAADGIHYGALYVAGSSYSPLTGILYGYGYNPVPDAAFNLSDVPSMPVPEPSTWALLVLGALFVVDRRKFV